ncbi:MAG: SRPBCC family protein, partial [Gemmatimonadaceae bacterium]
MRSYWVLAGVVTAMAAGTRVMAPARAGAAERAAEEKVLRIEITVPASRADVWKAFSTSEGLSTWLAPNSVVQLRPGGEWMVHFPGSSSAGGNIVSFVPEKEIVISALAPERFPT